MLIILVTVFSFKPHTPKYFRCVCTKNGHLSCKRGTRTIEWYTTKITVIFFWNNFDPRAQHLSNLSSIYSSLFAFRWFTHFVIRHFVLLYDNQCKFSSLVSLLIYSIFHKPIHRMLVNNVLTLACNNYLNTNSNKRYKDSFTNRRTIYLDRRIRFLFLFTSFFEALKDLQSQVAFLRPFSSEKFRFLEK